MFKVVDGHVEVVRPAFGSSESGKKISGIRDIVIESKPLTAPLKTFTMMEMITGFPKNGFV
jgi:hypothetical protein